MKKITALLTCALCLTLFACSRENIEVIDCGHEDYEELLEMLEDGDYEDAHAYIDELAHENDDAVMEEPAMDADAPVMDAPAVEAPAEEVHAAPDTGDLLSSVVIITEDNLGNRNDSTEEFWNYDSQGRIFETDSVELQEFYGFEFGTFVPHFEMEYDENDVVTKITVKEHEDVAAILTPEYDENGNLLHTHIITNTGNYDVYFTYDENGNRLTGERFDEWYNSIETFAYTYDESGLLLYKTHQVFTPWEFTVVTEYTYDEAGRVATATEKHTQEKWIDSRYQWVTTQTFYDYTYDENGKLLSIWVTTDAQDSNYNHKEVIYNYG